MYHYSMNTNLDTFGGAIDAIQAGLKAPAVDKIRRDDTLYGLLQTVKAAAGLDEARYRMKPYCKTHCQET